MNTEEDEFKRIEREALRRAAQDDDDDTQVYAKPWVGLTDEEWSDLYEAHHDKYNQPKQGGLDGLDYERAIEAALRSKNT